MAQQGVDGRLAASEIDEQYHRLLGAATRQDGLSEGAARELGHEIDLYKSRFHPLRNTLSGRDERMLMKLVVGRASDRVLGCHVLGPDAAEIVQMAAVALQLGARKADFDATVALHPSAAEELVTMHEKWVPA